MKDDYLNNLLGENEEILFVTRRHWLGLVGEIISESVLTIALIVLVTLLWVMLVNPLLALAYLLLIFPLVSMWRDVIIWLNRKYIVTNWRVIQMAGVFRKEVTDSSLEKVNDVKLDQSFLGRLLDFGDIEILTASEMGINRFKFVGKPIRLKTAMLNAKEKLERGQAAASVYPDASAIGLLAQLDHLRKQGVLTEEEFQQKKKQLLAKM
jgi:uncharacterized membrane protein YdbT with pleckstrin-like domain